MPKHGIIPATWTWKDDHDVDDYCRAVQGENAYRSAKEGSGNSMATRNAEVEPPNPLTRIEDHGQSDAEIVRLEFGRRYLSDKP